MNIDQFQEVKKDYDDLRFGVIDLYIEPETSKLIMLKSKHSNTLEEFKGSNSMAEERFKIRHNNILQMLDFNSNPESLETKMYFLYPNEDLYERKDQLQNPKMLLKFI